MNASSIAQALAPQLAALPTWATYEALARMQTNACTFGEKTELAVALRALHTATLSTTRPTGEAGAVTSKKEGDLSIGFGGSGSAGSATGSLNSTHWGQQLQDLITGATAFAGVTGVGGFCVEDIPVPDCGCGG